MDSQKYFNLAEQAIKDATFLQTRVSTYGNMFLAANGIIHIQKLAGR